MQVGKGGIKARWRSEKSCLRACRLDNGSMSITPQELSAFNQFAQQQITQGAADSLQKLVDEWNEQRDQQQSIQGIRESMAQHEAGQSLPADEVFRQVRSQLGWQ